MPRPRLPVVAAFVAVCLASTSARAADVAAASRVDAVTVFPRGAEITRLAKVALGQGDHTVILSDLPAQAMPGSIRVEGKATGKLDIGSVDTRRLRLQSAETAAAATDRKRIEDEIEKARDQRAGLQAQIETAQTQKTFIANLTELPKRPPPLAPGQPARQDDWTGLLSLIGTSMAEVSRAILDTQQKMREIDRRITDLERRLAALAPAPQERTEVKVNLAAGAALEAELTITYQVPNASWSSLYDARLATGTKTTPPRLTLIRRAAISQRTGEPWQNVRLALSTTRPNASTAAPLLNPITVDFEADRPPPRPMAQAPAAPMARSAPTAGAVGDADQLRRQRFEGAAKEAVAAQESQATLEQAPFQAVFTTQGRQGVPDTGESRRVFVQEEQLDPTLVVQTVPKLDQKAYLYAKVVMARGAPYLPGPVSLFRDATFVGTGQLPQLAAGQDHELGFGVDDNIIVRHVVVEEKRGETGLISSSRTDVRNFRISVKSRHERPLQLSIRDQIPASLNNDIKVELIGRLAPTRRDLDDKRGLIAWDSEIKPDEERIVDFGYRLTWPNGKTLSYGR